MSDKAIEPEIEEQSKAKVFISYSRKDLSFADRLDAALKQRGFEPLIDRSDIYALEDWWQRIEALIARADTVVFVLSPDAVASDVALREIARAAELNKRLAPIVYRRVDDRAIPDALRRLNFIFFDDLAGFEASVDTLAEALSTDIAWIRQHTAFGEAARRWATAGTPGGLLLRSPDLEQAEHWIASRPRGAPEPTQETQTFIAESRRGATRRRNLVTASLAAGLLVALTLAGVAYWQRGIARGQESIAQDQRRLADEQRKAAEEQRQQVITREMNRRAALAQELASAGRTKVATAVALDALRSGQGDRSPTPELRAAIHRTINMMKVPVERYIGDNVFNLALSPDGRTLAAGTVKGRVYILDAATLTPRFELNTGTDVVSGLDFSPDGKRLVASGDKIPNVWNVDTGEKLFDLQRPEAQRSAFHAQFSPDGKLIAVATAENRVLLHDAYTGELSHILPGASYEEMRDRSKTQSNKDFGVADPIVDAVNQASFQIWGAATDAIFSPDSRLVAITGPANPDASVRLFDAASGELLRTLTGGRGAGGLTPPFSYGSTFAFSPDGSSLIAAPVAVTIKIWDVKEGELRAEFPIRGISSFLLTTDGAALVSAHDNGSMIFRCLTQNSAVVSLHAHDGAIDSLSADRAGQLLATGATDQTARVWRMPKSSEICGFDQAGKDFDSLSVLRPTAILTGHGARITKAVFSPDDQTIITASQDGWVRGWSLGSDAATAAIALPHPEESYGEWQNALASSDGRTIFAYHSGRSQWYGWESETGRPLNISDSVRAIAAGKDEGPILFESPFSRFDLNSLPERKSRSFGSWRWNGPVSVDGSRVVASEAELKGNADGEAAQVLVDSDTKQVLARLVANERSAKDLIFSPDGTRLFGRLEKGSDAPSEDSGDGIAVWDSRSGTLIAVLASIPKYDYSTPQSISHDGGRLLLQMRNELLLFDISGSEIKSLDVPDTGTYFGSGRSVTASTLSANGRYLLAGRSDGAIVVVDIERDAIWRVLDAYRVAIKSVVISKDGRHVAAADDSNTLWIFDSNSGELVHSATFPVSIVSLLFLPGKDRLAILDRRSFTILPAVPSFGGRSDTAAIVDTARKLGLNLVSNEDRQRYKLGSAADSEQSAARQWAALDPNSEGTAPVVWGDTEDEARELSIAACQRLSTTCASTPAVTNDMESTFVFFCCTSPRLGCAVTSGSGDRPLRTVKEILAKANYSSCEVRAALSARDGSPR